MFKASSIEEVYRIDDDIKKEFFDKYADYIEKYKQFGMTLKIIPCYYYNGKYHTKYRISGCFLAFRIQIYPMNLTFKQAVKAYKYKDFFSHKILKIKKVSNFYIVKKFSITDIQIMRFLNTYIKKAEKYTQMQKKPENCINERISDVFISCIYIYRYRNEVKKTYHSFNLVWILLIFVIFLIALAQYMHIKRLTPNW